MSMLVVQNNGREIAATNYWELGTDKVLFSVNAGALRLLVPLGRENQALEMATGKVAVLSIGKDKRYGYERAHLMFDDGTDTPFAIESNLTAFDRLPTRHDDGKPGLECIVYGNGLRVYARLPLVIRHTRCPDYTPAEVPHA